MFMIFAPAKSLVSVCEGMYKKLTKNISINNSLFDTNTIVLMPDRQLLFCLDAKSNQKDQEKMMLAYAQAFAWPAIFSGQRTYVVFRYTLLAIYL